MDSNDTGVDFENSITTNDSINILNYEYLYNGGGVGVGDFNNDGLPDLVFAGNQVASKIYINKGNLKFEDITISAGFDTDDTWAFGVSIIDINQDGLQDIYLSAGGMGNRDIFPNKLFINNGNLTFQESAAAYGLADAGESIQAAFLDYDNDGDLDMYLLTGGGFEKSAIVPRAIVKDGSSRNRDRLYRNDFSEALGHPVYRDVSKEAGIHEEGFGLGVSILDINEDGWVDIYVTNDYISKDLLYVNNRDGTFTESSLDYFKHTSHFAMGHDIGDINNDGLMDIIAVDMLPEKNYRRKLMYGPNQYDMFYLGVKLGYGYQYMRNTLQVNNGNGTFSEIGQLAGIHKTDWSWAPLLADFDNDGYQDLFITNGFGKDVTDLDFVKFRAQTQALDKESRKKAFLDSLGNRPIIEVPNYAYKNNGNYSFSKVSAEWGFETPALSNGVVYVDLDNDGDLDLVVNNIDEKAFIYKNTLLEKGAENANFLRIKIKGPQSNTTGIGSTIKIFYDGKVQTRFQNVVRGFESSVEDFQHFGLGKNQFIDSLEVIWPDGRRTSMQKVPANQVIEVGHKESNEPPERNKEKETYFTTLSSSVLPYKHEENEYVDFNTQSLLFHKLSQEGPGIAVGDVNGDGVEDIFIGGPYRKTGSLFLQEKNGIFKPYTFPSDDAPSEDMGCLFFDADNDADLDLYVVSGSNEYFIDHQNYQDRLYINDGKGNFTKDVEAIPDLKSSGSCVVAGDFDQDGDLDLFVGGRMVPGAYPATPESYILENNNGIFTEITEKVAPGLKNVGMITAALWSDFDNDSQPDLIIVGEGMPISIFKNVKNKFTNITKNTSLRDSHGYWNSLAAGDFDNDGDIDFVAGNLGLNTPFKATQEEPMTISYSDFDNNGFVDPIVSYYEDGINYPFPSLDVLLQQVPSLKRQIFHYRSYAKTSTEELLEIAGNPNPDRLYFKTLETSFIQNSGDGTFAIKPLPVEAQFAPVYGMLAEDIDDDGNLDLLLVGNSYSPEVVTGRHDAYIGLALIGDGKNNFNALSVTESGFFVDGDAKGIARIVKPDGGNLFLVTQNNDSLKALLHSGSSNITQKGAIENNKVTSVAEIKNNHLEETSKGIVFVTENQDAYALLNLTDGKKRKVEMYYGSSFLSQSSRSIRITSKVESIEFYNQKGNLLRTQLINVSDKNEEAGLRIK